MQKLTFEEINNTLHLANTLFRDEYDDGSFDRPYSLLDAMVQQDFDQSQYQGDVLDSLGKITRMERFDPAIWFENYDDSTYQLYTVYHFEDHDVYIKFIGWWTSYNGGEFESMKQVFPQQKLVTIYE